MLVPCLRETSRDTAVLIRNYDKPTDGYSGQDAYQKHWEREMRLRILFVEDHNDSRQTPARLVACQTSALALTGFGTEEDIDNFKAAGVDAYLAKPVNFQKLEAAIWQLTSEREPMNA